MSDTSRKRKISEGDSESTEIPTNSKKVKIKSFKDKLTEGTYKAIKEMGFKTFTEIQAQAIPALLLGKEVIGIAKTGSGKTLAFLIPVIENLLESKIKPKYGTLAIILTPTRELAIQINEVLKSLLVHHEEITYGLVIGGVSRKTEVNILTDGASILVATPGRLLDHMQTTSTFIYSKLRCLVIDEVDRMFDYGFEEDMKRILKLLPKERQTMMFSATQTSKVQLLIDLAMKTQPIYFGVDDDKDVSTVSGVEQYYAVCPTEKRLLFLHSTLMKMKKKKVIVFFSSRNSVEFHYKFFSTFNSGINLMCLHGKIDQSDRTGTYFNFCDAEKAMLFCTDIAARGLDIPEVDVILQYDPPRNYQEYIHRVGRTARGEGKKGQALLVLRPEEIGFVKHLEVSKIPLGEYSVPWNKIKKGKQKSIENIVQADPDLNKTATEAFTSFMRAYSLHTMRDIFDIYSFCMKAVGNSFGFSQPPLVDLNLNVKKRKRHLQRFLGIDKYN